MSEKYANARTRAAFRRYASPDGRLEPGRVVLALGDLGLFEDDADSCDCEAVGRLILRMSLNLGAEKKRDAVFFSEPRFATTADVLAQRRRDANGLGVPGAGAPALVPPELLRNETLRRVFRSRAGRVGRVGRVADANASREDQTSSEKNPSDVDEYRLSASQFVAWLRDAGLFASFRLGDGTKSGLTEAGALVLFARARGEDVEESSDTSSIRLSDVSLRFAPDFVAALALFATATNEPVEAVAGALVMRPSEGDDEFTLTHFSGQIARLRACFAMLDVERRGFVRNDRLASVLAAGDAFSRRAARGDNLDAAAAFLHARVHERAPELGFVAMRDAREGYVSLRECEAHFLAAARSGFVPDAAAAETKTRNTFESETETFFDGVARKSVRDASTTFERFCAAGHEAGFENEPHPLLMDLERFERFAAEARLYDAKMARGAARVAFATAARGATRIDVSGFFSAVAAVARHKAMSPTDAVECVKRARTSRLAVVGIGGNDERFAPGRASRERTGSLNAAEKKERLVSNATPSRENEDERKSVPRRAPPPDPGALRVADPGRAAAVLDAMTRDGQSDIPASFLACVMADVGALAGVPLVEAGAAVEGARVALGTTRVTRDDCVRLISALADIREARLLDGSFHDETEVPGWIPPALEMYASDARLRSAYAAWATRGSLFRDPSFFTKKNRTLDERFAWERSVAEADARRRAEPSSSSSFADRKKENRDPSRDGSNAHAPLFEVCSRGHDEGDPREGYVRFRVDPVASGGADWPDEAQLLGRRVDSGLDRTRRARVPDARRVAVGAAHASRAAAARATARARERGDALGLPSLGTAGAYEGRWEAIHGDAARVAGDGGASSSPAIGMSLESFKTLIVQAGLTGDGRERKKNDGGARRGGSCRPFTAAAAEAAFATARAGDFRVRELSWGAFLDALALVASATGRTLGDVALRVREVKQPLRFEGRAPPVPRVTYVPEPPRVSKSLCEDGVRFDVDAFARACDEAHVSMRTSSAHRRGAARGVEEEEEERRRRERRTEEEEASRRATDDDEDEDEDDDDDDGKRRAEADARRGTSAEIFFSEPSVVAPSSPEGLASTWRQHTSKLDLGTSLVASLRASEYYRRARG